MVLTILPPHTERFRLHPVERRYATPVLGGKGAFTAAIVTRIGLTSAVWLIGLVAACEIVRMLDPFGRGRATT